MGDSIFVMSIHWDELWKNQILFHWNQFKKYLLGLALEENSKGVTWIAIKVVDHEPGIGGDIGIAAFNDISQNLGRLLLEPIVSYIQKEVSCSVARDKIRRFRQKCSHWWMAAAAYKTI